MAKTEPLKDLLRRKKAQDESAVTRVDWAARKRDWLASVNSLYKQVESWLAPSVKEVLIAIRRRPIEIQEQFLGKYRVDELVLEVGRSDVRFTPVGHLVAGAQGRIDVHSGPDIVTLLRVSTDDGWSGWVVSNEGEGPYALFPLTKDELTNILERFFGE